MCLLHLHSVSVRLFAEDEPGGEFEDDEATETAGGEKKRKRVLTNKTWSRPSCDISGFQNKHYIVYGLIWFCLKLL